MTLGNTYVPNLISVHQIGDLKCCLVEDYHRRSMNLITVGCMAHICKAPFKRLSDSSSLAIWLAKGAISFPPEETQLLPKLRGRHCPHLLRPTLIPRHSQLTCRLLWLSYPPNTAVLPFTETFPNSSKRECREKR